jgi:hypothetical protein
MIESAHIALRPEPRRDRREKAYEARSRLGDIAVVISLLIRHVSCTIHGVVE